MFPLSLAVPWNELSQAPTAPALPSDPRSTRMLLSVHVLEHLPAQNATPRAPSTAACPQPTAAAPAPPQGLL